MLGFFIGIGSLIGLRWAIRRAYWAGACERGARGDGRCSKRGWHRGRYGRGWHHERDDWGDAWQDDWHESDRRDAPRRGGMAQRGMRKALRMLFWRLDTSPGQEKAIRAEAEQLMERMWNARRSMQEARGAVAQAMRGEAFDEAPISERFASYSAELEQMRSEITAALGRIHEVLDPRQRELLADMLDQGGFRGGPYRG